MQPMKLAIILTSLFLFLISCLQASYSTDQQHFTSVFSFGDSLADTGNFLNSGAKAFPSVARLPYGMTYFRRPTGRCSDGRLVVDFIAEAFGLPLLRPYLGQSQHGENFRQGVNFAVAGATALDASFFQEIGVGNLIWTNYSLSEQLRWFQKLKPSLCTTSEDCNNYFSKSLFLVGEIGGNDYNYPFFTGKSIQEIKSYVPKVVESIVTTAQRLIDEGAVYLVVPGNLPIGCSAAYLTLFRSPNRDDYDPRNGCLKSHNSFASYHNVILRRALQELQRKNPRVRIVYADYYGAVLQFAESPNDFVFRHGAVMACCGGGGPYNFNIMVRCGEAGSTVCEDPSLYVNWDGLHLTEAAYRNIAQGLLQGPFADPPLTRLFHQS